MNLIVAISTVNDGNMLIRDDKSNQKVISNRSKFLAKNKIDINQTTMVSTVYEGNDYCRYREVTNTEKSKGMFSDDIIIADALITRSTNHALFLPIADCVGAVIFDPKRQILMLSHLGRHSTEQNGGYKSVKFLIDNYNCNPNDILIYLTPAPNKDSYPLFAFNNRSLKDVLFEQFKSTGILMDNITDSPIDNTKDKNYFSHSEFLKDNRSEDGRYAIVAMIKG